MSDIEEACRYFYDKGIITSKEMANLICGTDPRVKPLKYNQHNYKKVYEQITYEFKCVANTKLESETIFNWAIEHFTEFNPSIPKHYVIKPGLLKNKPTVYPPVVVSGSSEKIKQDYINAMRKNGVLEKKIIEQKKEIDRLSVFENKANNKALGNKQGGRNSRGIKKNY